MPTRLLIVGFDSAEPLLVKALAAKGAIPTISALMEEGQTAAIENFPGFGNGAFWPSLNTGVDPTYHARYYRRQPIPATFSLEPFHNHDFKSPPFWKALDEKGMRVAVIDPVESPGANPEHGIEVIDWMSHGRPEQPRTSPSDLLDELKSRYGDDPFNGNADLAVKTGLAPEMATEIANQRISCKTEAMLDLLGRDDWDMFYTTYADPHDVGHVAWHLHETEETRNTTDRRSDDYDPVEQCYRKLDAALAKLMKAVVPEGQTILLMGPGIETNVTANALLPDILRAFQGRPKSSGASFLAKAMRSLTRSSLLPTSLVKSLRTSKARASARMKGMSGARYFPLPHNDNAGAVRINLAGRDPHGNVSQGREYDDLCIELTNRLMLIRDASGKVPLVSKVIKLHDHYNGPHLDLMPDLFVVWNRQADVSEISSPDIGKLANRSENHRTGDHSRRGLVISSKPFFTSNASPLDPTQVTPILVGAANMAAIPT